MRIGKGEKL